MADDPLPTHEGTAADMEVNDMEVNDMTVNVEQGELDKWRAFTKQTRTDLFTLRQLISRGQGPAAAQLIGSMLEQTIIAGLGMEDAGANRPPHLPARPAPGTYIEEEHE
ncbi:MAG: hypothetical protein ACRYFS_15525 [Janthinobacterium lividum]